MVQFSFLLSFAISIARSRIKIFNHVFIFIFNFYSPQFMTRKKKKKKKAHVEQIFYVSTTVYDDCFRNRIWCITKLITVQMRI